MDSLRRDSRSRRALTLLLIVLLETGIATSDARTPQDIPVSQLFYLPIVLGAWAFAYTGGIATAVVSLALFSLANYVAHAPDDPGCYLFAATLTLALYLGVGLGVATFFARQRRITALGRQLAARVSELDTLYAVAHTLATEEALLPPSPRASWSGGPRLPPVLRLVAVGTSNKEIARELGITERAAKAHVSHILQKLGTDDRTAAVTTALIEL